jgi:tRNA dimethylallyltransferase
MALDLARREGRVIVNADSMQVYSVLRLLTARPGEDELNAAPHFLYGHVDPRRAYSTGEWLRDVERLAASGAFAGPGPIFVGGTGLYFRALLGGLSAMPGIPSAVRDRWRRELEDKGAERLHRLLSERDAAAAAAIGASDGQRIVRALEVLDASGRSILEWRAEAGEALVERASARLLVIEPDRAALRARIDARFDGMVAAGALAEVEAFRALGVEPSLPAAKAIGLRELGEAMAGRLPLEAAIERAKAATRQYAKRQMTWFRHQLGPEWRRLGP